MELSIVIALGFWGSYTGSTTVEKIILAIGSPLLVFGFWSAVDFHQAGRFSELLRLIQELVISGLAALALIDAGQLVFGWMLAFISILHHALVYLLGQRLIKQKT